MNVGIDLGTTFSVISRINEQGIPALFPDFHDPNIHRTPSVVHVGERGCLVGEVLENLLEDEPELLVSRFFKLKMGTDEEVYQDHEGRGWRSDELSAMVLRKLIRDAESIVPERVSGAVVTVPAQFGDASRRATKNAAMLAGFQEVLVADEPIAAAYYYGQDHRKDDSTLFVYDLGGGTFDATILQAAPEGLFVLATEGVEVGGKDFDEEIITIFSESFKSLHGIDPRTDQAAMVQLRRFAEATKIKLSQPGRNQVKGNLLLCGKPHEFFMTASQFESLIEKHLLRTMEVCESCLRSVGLGWDAMDVVLLTGGSSRLPLVRSIVSKTSGLPGELIKQDKPDMAVSYGAALMAEGLEGNGAGSSPTVYHQVASHDLAIRVKDPNSGRPVLQPLIHRNSPLPASGELQVSTWRDDQRQIDFEFVQACSNRADILELGTFAFGPIASPRSGCRIALRVRYDEQGMVDVSATDLETGTQMQHTIKDQERFDSHAQQQRREFLMSLPVNE